MAAKKKTKDVFDEIAEQNSLTKEQVVQMFNQFIVENKPEPEPEVSPEPEPAKPETYARKTFIRKEGIAVFTPASSDIGDEFIKEYRSTNGKTEGAIFRGNGKPVLTPNADPGRRF